MSVSERPIVPFAQFVQSLHAARAEHHLNVPHNAIANEDSFDEMQAYLTNYYDGVSADPDCARSAHRWSPVRGFGGSEAAGRPSGAIARRSPRSIRQSDAGA
jgi:hypothetical protein